MLTLSRWRDFATTPKTTIFPHLELIGYDHAPPVVVGAGEVHMASPTDFTFKLTGKPHDVGYAMSELNRHHRNRYDPLSRLRLEGVDREGNNWAGGYTVPQVDTGSPNWTFRGELDSLSTDDHSETVSTQPYRIRRVQSSGDK